MFDHRHRYELANNTYCKSISRTSHSHAHGSLPRQAPLSQSTDAMVRENSSIHIQHEGSLVRRFPLKDNMVNAFSGIVTEEASEVGGYPQSVQGSFSQDSSASHVEELDFLTSKFTGHVINDELKINIYRSFVEDGKVKPEAALKLEMVERIALQLALSSLANNVRLSAKNSEIIHNGEWNFDRIGYDIPIEIKHMITKTLIPIGPHIPDRLKWTPSHNGIFTTKSAYEQLASQNLCKLANQPTTYIEEKHWQAPNNGIKLNVDGSFNAKTKLGGAGGLIRNQDGKWMTDFSASINVNSTFEAEARALLMGLQMVVKNNYNQIIIATDSLQLYKELYDSDTKVNNLICLCRALLQQMGNLLVLHEDRSTNAVADRLAKEGNKLAQDSFCEEWVVPPMFIRKELELDKEGTTLVGQYMSLSMDICICSARKELSPARHVLTICTND
ncbi:hypothetical protein FXO37_16277 [Capsicum annuum]|nr:hypothetical protein FXO37_16277 [Capsicum annuum]